MFGATLTTTITPTKRSKIAREREIKINKIPCNFINARVSIKFFKSTCQSQILSHLNLRVKEKIRHLFTKKREKREKN